MFNKDFKVPRSQGGASGYLFFQHPQTRSQALMLMDHYSKTPIAITTSEGTAFAQSGKKKMKVGNKKKKPEAAKDPKDFDKEWWKDKECYRCGKKGHLATVFSVKLLSDNDNKSICEEIRP